MNDNIVNAMADLEDDLLFDEVQKAYDEGTPVADIVAALQTGLKIVGDRFEEKEYFLSELMMSADLFKEATEIFGGEDEEDMDGKVGTFLIATVETDIHDIGKNIVASVMKSNGFRVIDMGVDVPVQKVVEAIKEYQPQVIGLSCLLTTCFDKMKATIDAIRAEGLDEGRLILIGGGPVDEKTVAYVGADSLSVNAQANVLLAKKFLGVEA